MAGGNSVAGSRVRRNAASPAGPESTSAAQASRVSCSRRCVLGGSGPAGGPRGLRVGGAVQVAELAEGQVELDLGGLPGPAGDVPGRDQPPAGPV
jgi:hypothetical protein